jgi:hypothetical protein
MEPTSLSVLNSPNIEIHTDMPERFEMLEQWLRDHHHIEIWQIALKRMTIDRTILLFGLHPQKLNQFFAQKQGLVLDCIFEREKHQMVGGICLDVVAGELIVTTHT